MAINSTKIKGPNAKGRNYSAAKVAAQLKEAERKMESSLEEREASDEGEGSEPGRAQCRGVKGEDRAPGKAEGGVKSSGPGSGGDGAGLAD